MTYTTQDGTAYEFDAVEFLARLSAHIPNTYKSVTRYYGYYSCRARGERIERIYKIDPLECPKCKSQMHIIAFVQDPAETKKLMHSLAPGSEHLRLFQNSRKMTTFSLLKLQQPDHCI